ncbi:MAG: ComEC/Rec2 family competence protein [Alphaproteobacteria bacterium]|nr:ComEC/Rec2 family competence protein [Alphaproteobacteria bacterium]
MPKSLLSTEYKSLSDFFAVAFIIGILASFSGLNLPYFILAPILIALTIFLIQKRGQIFKPIALLLTMGLLGMGAAHYRTEQISNPVLQEPLYGAEIIGIVQNIVHLPDYQKITIDNIHILNNAFSATPKSLRLNYSNTPQHLKIGDIIRLRADIRPPHRPVFPGAYNEARTLYFEGIGGVGKIYKILSVQQASSGFQNRIEEIRTRISQRLNEVLPDEPARIAIPLSIGDQHVIPKELYDMFRSAGIVHILSISGFHLSLLAAFVFFVVRGLLAFFPFIAERISPKKTAAILALIAVMGYILISGMQIPAIRSFIMIAFVLTAILFDRTAFSIRSLSIAALAILFYRPEFIFNIGFQRSFTAVLILITLYQPFEKHFLNKLKSSSIGKFIRLFLGIAMASCFITCATTPLTLFHFNQYAPYGILGNVLTGLILSFWVMPLLFLGLLLMPLGMDAFCFKAAGIGISYITAICDKIQHWPNAFIRVPAFDTDSLCLMILGIILICMMKTRLKGIGILICLAGIILGILEPRADLFIGDKGQTVAIRKENGLQFLSAKPHSQTTKIWLIKNGEEPFFETPSQFPPNLIHIKGKKISLTWETCEKADLCMHQFPKDQTYLIYISDKIRIKTP